ncbi:hypothetical protein KA017_03100 [Candidatus Woesebacteria bacterium]|nr:hypothetical protein [Candidatus Woesebacteria bacterium]
MTKLNKKITAITLTIISFFTSTVPSFAAIINPVTGELGNDAEKAASGETFVDYFTTLWNTAVTIGAVAVLIMFLWGALEWITAGGDSSKIEKARSRIMQSIIGLLILVSSFVIIGFISQLFFGEEFSILNLSFTKVGGEE